MLNFDKEVVPTIGHIGIDVNMVQCLQQKVVICSKEYEAMNGAWGHPWRKLVDTKITTNSD